MYVRGGRSVPIVPLLEDEERQRIKRRARTNTRMASERSRTLRVGERNELLILVVEVRRHNVAVELDMRLFCEGCRAGYSGAPSLAPTAAPHPVRAEVGFGERGGACGRPRSRQNRAQAQRAAAARVGLPIQRGKARRRRVPAWMAPSSSSMKAAKTDVARPRGWCPAGASLGFDGRWLWRVVPLVRIPFTAWRRCSRPGQACHRWWQSLQALTQIRHPGRCSGAKA